MELNWCLAMLESMQTHRSVSDLAKHKVNESQQRPKASLDRKENGHKVSRI